MNYIQQNAIDLCAGLRELKWNRLEQEMLRAPMPNNFNCAQLSDLNTTLFADEDTSHLPQQIRNRIAYINRTYGARTGEYV